MANVRAVTQEAKTFSQTWGDDPFTKAGHTQVPNALIEYSCRLKLTAEECWLITCILRFKYDSRDPYPSEERLAALFGQSTRNIRRIAAKLKAKNLLDMPKTRLDSGHYGHTVFVFDNLRNALNECYYQDHPEERPTTGQNGPNHRTELSHGSGNHRTELSKRPDKTVQTTGHIAQKVGQNCPINKTLNKKKEEDSEEEPGFLTSSFPDWNEIPDSEKENYRATAVASSTLLRQLPAGQQRERSVDRAAKELYKNGVTAGDRVSV